MRIGEVSNIVGLDVSSIRFYERKGLINPDRGEDNKYRDYSLEDIECLKQIVLLRKLDMSIEDIKSILVNENSIENMLYVQMKKLQQDRQRIDGSIMLCKKMIDEKFDLKDTDAYISYVSEAEKEGVHFPDIMPVLDRISENSRLEYFIGYPFFIKIVNNKFYRRLLAIGLFGILVIFPISEVIFYSIRYKNGIVGFHYLLSWIVYAMFSISCFAGILLKKEKK